MQTQNILLQDWQTPFKMPPFEAIRDEDFLPAFEEAMRLHLAEVEEIAENPAEPTFANTVEALERAGHALRNTASVFFNLASADTNEERQGSSARISPKLSGHGMAILTNAKLFARIAKLFDGTARAWPRMPSRRSSWRIIIRSSCGPARSSTRSPKRG